MNFRKRCARCGRTFPIFGSEKIIQIEDPVNEDSYMHETCFLYMKLGMKEEKIQELEKQLKSANRMSFELLSDANKLHKEKKRNKKDIKIVMSPEIYNEGLKDIQIKKQELINTTKNEKEWLGMKVVTDSKITGWYIK